MQIAGKAVEHVEKYIDVMDLHSTEIMRDMIFESLADHNRIQGEISDPLNRYEFEQVFAEDVARAQAALHACEKRMGTCN